MIASNLFNNGATDEALRAIRSAAESAARRDTCLPEDQETWNENDPLHGHCGALAYVLYRLFGGEILSGRENGIRWLWNRFPDGREVALTEEDWKPLPKKGRVFAPKTINPRFSHFSYRITKILYGVEVELGFMHGFKG